MGCALRGTARESANLLRDAFTGRVFANVKAYRSAWLQGLAVPLKFGAVEVQRRAITVLRDVAVSVGGVVADYGADHLERAFFASAS